MPSAAEQASFLQVTGVTKEFDGYKAVDDVTLDVGKGEIVALLGPSGCGKSTLLRMLAGFETPSAGRIVLAGRDLAGLPAYERPINMMFQSYALFPHLSVEDNVAFGLRRERLAASEVASRVDAMLKLVQLTRFARRKPHQLSGGQQQRVALARSLAKRPQLLLLDEPLGALDRKLREQTQIELVNIVEQVGVTCVLVTHDQEEAMTMASRVAVMSEGRFLQVGRPADIYETPASRFVADFIGNVNLMDGKLVVDEADYVEIDCGFCRHRVGHGISGSLGMPVTVALRPEKLHLRRTKPPGQLNQVHGHVRDRSYFGSFTVYVLELAGGQRLKVSEGNVDRYRVDAPAVGDSIWATWPDSAPVVLTQ
jgi:putrescine transport system ATP-binding protein